MTTAPPQAAAARAHLGRAWALCSVVAAADVVLVGAVVTLPQRAPLHPVPWPLLALAVLGSKLTPVEVRFRRQSLSINATAALVPVAAAFAAPWAVVLAAAVGYVGCLPFLRPAPVKAVHNLLSTATAAAAAVLAYHAVSPSGTPGPLTWAATAAACIVSFVVSVGLTTAVIALVGGRLRSDQLTGALLSIALIVPAEAMLAILTVSAMWVTRWALAGFGAAGLLLFFMLRRQRTLQERYENLELLYRFSDSLAGLTEAADVVTAILAGVEELLSCQHADLLLIKDSRRWLSSLHPSGALVHADGPDLDALLAAVLACGSTVTVTRSERDQPLREALATRGWRDAVATPIRGTGGIEGILVAGDRLDEVSTFSATDARLLEALAAHSSVALRSSELLDRLREQVAARSHEALHDALTGLGNRTQFTRRLLGAIDRLDGDHVGVIVIDLNDFKQVNDTLGHRPGDLVLQAIGHRLRDVLGERGVVTRIGGDEFAVIVTGCTEEDRVTEVGRELAVAVTQPIAAGTEDKPLDLSVSAALGVAVAPVDGTDPSALLRRAEVAMYDAKTAGSVVERYDRHRDPNTTRRLRLTSDLRSAIEDGLLEVWYQPKAQTATGRVVGVEALCRWLHPEYGFVPPDEFIALAEHSGQIDGLTELVATTALRQLRAWDLDLNLRLQVSVNISPRSLRSGALVDALQCTIAAERVHPGRLTLELTESSIMSGGGRSEERLVQLAETGVRIAIDDFGTGYSSLSRLNRLPVSEIKIDKSFVMEMLAGTTEPIVAATIDLARSLHLSVTAEGVEDRATWDRLGQLGCDAIQGYHLARPMPAAECTNWLRRTTSGKHVAIPA